MSPKQRLMDLLVGGVNGKLVFSKLEKGGFPVFKEVVQVVLDCSQGSEPREVIEIAPNSCSLM
ncbi:hypothetical protein P5673_017988 [Acropora cervicornis]|uniref:Uncharacterized protein n=1 Tax=Acropora cervicornis TaxID=6130 RepID=A0AAD9V303_ACRCE|nr:hypothetical protein P5673_017988 [Acropora cervicornis]